MTTYASFAAAFMLAAGVSALIVRIVRTIGRERGLLDRPNARSSHAVPTPRGGGVGIVLVVLGGIALLAARAPTIVPLGVGLFCIAVTGFIDDLRGLRAVSRLLIHTAVAILTVVAYGAMTELLVPGLPVIQLGIAGPILTIAWIVGLTNAYNFMDGIDGIAAGQAVIAALAWAVFCLTREQTAPAMMATLVAGASAGFLLFNWPPASIFMGDVGSGALGYVFASLPLVVGSLDPERGHGMAWFFGLTAVVPFVFDATYTFLARARRRENVLQAHRSHLYQRLVKRGLSHRQVAAGYIALASYTAGIALWTSNGAGWRTSLAIVIPLVLLLAGVHAVERVPPMRQVRGDL